MFLDKLDNIEHSVFSNPEHDINFHFVMTINNLFLQLIRNYSPYIAVNKQ